MVMATYALHSNYLEIFFYCPFPRCSKNTQLESCTTTLFGVVQKVFEADFVDRYFKHVPIIFGLKCILLDEFAQPPEIPFEQYRTLKGENRSHLSEVNAL